MSQPDPGPDEAFFVDDGQAPDGDDRAEVLERRRRGAQLEEGAPREGVDIIRQVEQAVLVGVQLPGRTDAETEASLDELARLLDTAGGEVLERVVQRRDAPSAATFIGGGKVSELRDLVAELGADAVVFDDELSPAQQRTLEERIGQKVLDRTMVILDIFAQHATSREGKAQVELAQLIYLLPRLRGWGVALSRQAGGRAAGGMGIGGRGPGETQLEVDRRRITRRMAKLKRDLAEYGRVRATKAAERQRGNVQVAALVGYTNAGKSSLLNRLTGAQVETEDRLFATVDPTVRRMPLDGGRDVVLTDTVGFVRKLPHGLIEAFTSTLEESVRADLLLHVVDSSHPEAEAHILAVHDVLTEIGADQVPELIVLNKADATDEATVTSLARRLQVELGADPVIVSAHDGRGIDALIERIVVTLPNIRIRVEGHVPYTRQDLVALAHENGTVHKEAHTDTGTSLIAEVDEPTARALRSYLDDDPFADEIEPWEQDA